MILKMSMGLLGDIVADDAEASIGAVVFNDPPEGALGISSHEVGLVQHDDLEVRAEICPTYP